MGVIQSCKPRKEVLEGDLQDAIFAADFGHVIDGRAPAVYQDPKEFFRNTHPAQSLREVTKLIFDRLASSAEAGTALRLSTGFGGGKTHTLIALWHLARHIKDSSLGTDVLPAAGRPSSVRVVAFDGEKAGSDVCLRHPELVTHSLWGEIAYQLGGPEAYKKVVAVDSPDKVPDAALLRDLFPTTTPVLLLLDELVKYIPKLSAQGQTRFLTFIGALVSEIQARPQTVLVITDPAGQAAYEEQSEDLKKAIQDAARKLDDELDRKTSHFDPIGKETAKVVTRRLFDPIDPAAAEKASADYFTTYKRIAEERPDLLPADATREYAERIVECYPFHPRLLETARDRFGGIQDFQKSRGTLRLFARILRDVWEQNADLDLVSAGDINWSSGRIQADLLERLGRSNFKSAVEADVERHAGKLDQEFSTDVHRRVASALLLESIPLTPQAAMDGKDITLATVRPAEVGHEPAEAMDRLMGVCWHTYPDESHTKYQFRYEQNVNAQIEERAQAIPLEDARSEARTVVQSYFGGQTFKLRPFPSGPSAVADVAELKLVVSESEQVAQAICDFEDDSDPVAKAPRGFRNAILAVAPSQDLYNSAVQSIRRMRAAELILKENSKNKILKEQLDGPEGIITSLKRQARFAVCRAYNRVLFNGRPGVTLEEKYLVSDSGAMAVVNGQQQLKQFLDDQKLIYQLMDALDVDLLMEHLLTGATPSVEHDGAVTASSVHERALGSAKLKLLMNDSPVRGAILRALEQNRLAVRLADGAVYDAAGSIEGGAGARVRIAGKKLTALKLERDVLLAPMNAPCVKAWTQVDAAPSEESLTIQTAAARKLTSPDTIQQALRSGEIDAVMQDGVQMVANNSRFANWQPPIAPGDFAYSWEDAIRYAADRPLRRLSLGASSVEDAKMLAGLAPPLGAQKLVLSVSAGGDLKDGGQANFAVGGLKPNHPLQPLDIATKLFRAMQEGASFSAELALEFGEQGLADAPHKLEQARDQAPEAVSVQAEFGRGEQG